MKARRSILVLAFATLGMLVLILDAQTALQGALEGIRVCLYTVVPSLFPFIFLAGLLNEQLVGRQIPLLGWIGRICGIPSGAESLLLLGLMGGYPVGARSIAQAYRSGQLDKHTAHRLLGFCNNAGPAFIFGMLAPMFSMRIAPLLIWLIHILSAILTGLSLPGKRRSGCKLQPSPSLTVAQLLEHSVKTVGSICGWVILFRLLLTIGQRLVLWHLPMALQVLLTGLCELSNGIVSLSGIDSENIRFLLAGVMLSFGGLCVAMQTASVTGSLGTGMYFPGKLLQTAFTIILLLPVSQLLYGSTNGIYMLLGIASTALLGLVAVFFIHCRKKLWQSAVQ